MKKKLLLVDDDKVILNFSLFLKKDFNVATAMDGQSALKIIETNPDMDIIVSDLHMPKMGGMKLLEKAREIIPHVGFWIFTGMHELETEMVDRAFWKLGVDRILQKPIVDFDKFVGELKKLGELVEIRK